MLGYANYDHLPLGVSYQGDFNPSDVAFFVDKTYTDSQGQRQTDQQIFEQMFALIRSARQLIILDQFLFNDFIGLEAEITRKLTDELTHCLIAQKRAYPDLQIYFITDPINSFYGGTANPYLKRLTRSGITVVTTDLDQLRDSNPTYSFFWRLLVRPFGNRPGGIFPGLLSKRPVTLRSYLTLLNLKANHRKTLLVDDGKDDWIGLISTGNPHNASSAHSNVAITFKGQPVHDLYITERAVLEMAGIQVPEIDIKPQPCTGKTQVSVISEGKIKRAVVEAIDKTRIGDSIYIVMFYLSDRDVINALKAARKRDVEIFIIFDLNVNAFGKPKIGIPNRPVASDLTAAGVNIRWANTHGEQCHSKLMLINYADADACLILGSANFTRRNLDDFNLETDVVVRSPWDSSIISEVEHWFNAMWRNEDGKTFTVNYETYENTGWFRFALYWFMEKTGISTF